MSDSRVFGGVGSKVILENDRVRIWEMRLEPGQREALHRHDLDYVMVQITGDRVAGEFEPDAGGTWGGETVVEGDVSPGNVIYAERGGIERAHNIGKEPFYEIIIELKD